VVRVEKNERAVVVIKPYGDCFRRALFSASSQKQRKRKRSACWYHLCEREQYRSPRKKRSKGLQMA
jgi:hypothetical protein